MLPKLLALLLTLAAPFTAAQLRFQSPVERSGFLRLTSYDTLQLFLGTLEGGDRIHIQKIATTRQGRSVVCCFASLGRFGADTSKTRVLLFAQQHGDEPSGKEALTLLLAKIADHSLDSLLSRLDILIVPQMNPDGSELRQRRTSDSLDLNRNHMLLTSPETRGLHDLFAGWMPQVTLDVHEYGPYSRSWSDSGFVKRADVQLGMLTNLNSPVVLCSFQHKIVFPFVAEEMRVRGYQFHEYIVGSPGGGIRYSTTEPNDGRQSFGILGTLSFIQEGRGGRTLEDGLERRARSQLASIEALLSVSAARAAEIRALVFRARRGLAAAAGSEVVLCLDHFAGTGSLTIPVRRVPSGRDTVWTVTSLHDVVRSIASRSLPRAYVIPGTLTTVKELLDRHHVKYERVPAEQTDIAEMYLVDSIRPDTLEDEWHPMPSLRSERREVEVNAGDLIVRTSQLHSFFLGILLEPESMWGLVKYPEFQSLLKRGEYPIRRIP